jgi:hypothetical protein
VTYGVVFNAGVKPTQDERHAPMGNKLRKSKVAQRYDIDERSVDRWKLDGRLPPPTYFGRTPLWDEDELDESDRKFAALSRSGQTTA